MTCTWCNSPLLGEERERPKHDSDGDIICDECHTDEYCDMCPLCEGYYLKSEQASNSLLAVIDSDLATPGIYQRIGELFSVEQFDSRRVVFVSPIPQEIDSSFFPAAYLCNNCAKKWQEPEVTE